jgi:uroporphyrinogen decarboxylase
MGVDWRIRISEAWSKVGHSRAVQGNLDPAVLLSDVKTIETYAKGILDETNGRPGHIFNLVHQSEVT